MTNENENKAEAKPARVSRLQTCLTLSKLAANAEDAEERRAILEGLKAYARKAIHRERYKANRAAKDAGNAGQSLVDAANAVSRSVDAFIAKLNEGEVA